jgi:serine/threonine-protein kinase
MSIDPRISHLILRWHEERRQGRTPSLEELCADCPELREAVARQIDNLESTGDFLGSTAASVASSEDPNVTNTKATAPDVVDPSLPTQAGRFQLLGEIARGGMGAVLKGHDPDLGRDIAVKVVLPKGGDNPELLRRFARPSP